MQEENGGQRCCRDERRSDERVCDTTMMLEGLNRSFNRPDDIRIGSFRRQHHSQRGQARFSVEAGASHTGARQEMCERVQVLSLSVLGLTRQ